MVVNISCAKGYSSRMRDPFGVKNASLTRDSLARPRPEYQVTTDRDCLLASSTIVGGGGTGGGGRGIIVPPPLPKWKATIVIIMCIFYDIVSSLWVSI
jgi:hypothetical protein